MVLVVLPGGWAGRARRVTERNILFAFPDLSAAEQQTLAKRSLIATGELAAEMGYVWNRPWETVRGKITELDGVDKLKEAIAAGRGVVVLGPHIGNWEVGGLFLSEVGDALALYEPPHMQALDTMIRDARERSGTKLAATDARGLATLVKTLRRGGITGILPDQVPPVIESGREQRVHGYSVFYPNFCQQSDGTQWGVGVFLALRSAFPVDSGCAFSQPPRSFIATIWRCPCWPLTKA